MHHRYRPQHLSDPTDPTDRSADHGSADQPAGRHRASRTIRRARLGTVLSSPPARLTLAAGLTCCLGLAAAAAATRTDDRAPAPEPTSQAVLDRAAAAERAASRAHRAATPVPATPSPSEPSPTPSSPATTSPPAPSPTRTRPAKPTPVAGLTQAQMDNAAAIVKVGREMDIPRQGLIVAIATAMQESNLYNLASGAVPESQNYPNQGLGWDHDSVGLFQQRASTGWGAVADLMRPAYAARKFFEALLQIPGWQNLSLSAAAQAVQISAFPDAYAQHEGRATTVVDALL
nr:hypothetical protein [Micromonospora sp. DSM 115978]